MGEIPKTERRLLLVLLATAVGSSVVILDGTIVNLALPKIATDFNVGFTSLQWITDGYLLSLSALILLGGSLGDIFGRKKVYLIGLVGFGISSLLCALAPNVTVLILTRVLQGVFGALLVPGALSIITTSFAGGARSKAIGRWTAWSTIAIVAAPFLGGWILDVANWRWIFLINIPLIAICLTLALLSIHESKDKNPRKVDLIGAALVSLGLAGVTYGLIEGPAQHWPVATIASLIVGILLGLAFLLHESRTKDPMVKLALFKSRNFTGSNLMTFLVYGALGGFTFALVIYLQEYLHYTALQAGMSLLPISFFLVFFAGKVGALSAKYGPRFFMTVGPLIAAIGIAWLWFLRPGDSYITGVFPGVVLFSIGLALLVSPLTTTVMTSIDETSSGIASGINNAVARVAGLVVIAVLGVFGTDQVYFFATALCACLAAAGGVVSYIVIRKPLSQDEHRSKTIA